MWGVILHPNFQIKMASKLQKGKKNHKISKFKKKSINFEKIKKMIVLTVSLPMDFFPIVTT